MPIMILKFNFPKFLSLMFFGQIWSYNLDFFKFSEILKSGTLLYAHYNVDIYFVKIFVTNIFWINLVQIFEVYPKGLKLRTGLHCYKLITILMFIFSKFYHSYNYGQIWSQNLTFFKLTKFDTRAHCYMMITVLMCNFSNYLLFIYFVNEFISFIPVN